MKQIKEYFMAIAIIILAIVIGCSNENTQTSEEQDSGGLTIERGEHSRDVGEKSEGEESGTQYALNETYNQVRNGARLVLSYNAENNSFMGTVENTTNGTLKRLRIEVHLSNGIELGPTKPVDLRPSKKVDVILPASEKKFETWTAHPEVGSGERGHGEEDGEHEGEHN